MFLFKNAVILNFLFKESLNHVTLKTGVTAAENSQDTSQELLHFKIYKNKPNQDQKCPYLKKQVQL